MAIDPTELKTALAELDPLTIADIVSQSGKTLADSDGIRQAVIGIARQIADAAAQWSKLRATATTADGQAVFDKRLMSAVQEAAAVVKLTTEQKAIVGPFVTAILQG